MNTSQIVRKITRSGTGSNNHLEVADAEAAQSPDGGRVACLEGLTDER
jgi:hypothetical protein